MLCILGPTASGKSSLAMALAQHDSRIEIVSMDSALVYKGMDIGTAKPSSQDQLAVPHHLLDLIAPSETYSAARFVRDAHEACEKVRSRQKIPILVGGTMLYFKAYRDGLDDLPSAPPPLRDAISARAAGQGWPALHRELAQIDPNTAARLKPTDAQRISRALELFELTGKT
ncbi:MAG: tRNA (adenosine(37)-N6)-dimethylallyltransferase MiaA, partial [Burkholderiales bacterium]